MDNARTTSNRLRTENQELKTETKELKKELGKMKDISHRLESAKQRYLDTVGQKMQAKAAPIREGE
ncbi:hypothetical protein NXX02_21215 [Bacteroides fragilis]|nr:hypothetical protein [Bacteroides fragilis]